MQWVAQGGTKYEVEGLGKRRLCIYGMFGLDKRDCIEDMEWRGWKKRIVEEVWIGGTAKNGVVKKVPVWKNMELQRPGKCLDWEKGDCRKGTESRDWEMGNCRNVKWRDQGKRNYIEGIKWRNWDKDSGIEV